ncbi:DUF2608 domain-containing protein [Legionella gresilensis]|uniref:DUF2608 domain-containing protein n=1 Tax=Legionella gresilensis TaxID=91823 RepID=UPI0010413D1E|nr:DUF2608 domain-containing protein [Legionella gresilensis]
MRILLFLIFSVFFSPLFAKVINYQTDSFTEIAALYNKANIDPKTTLLVFDLDDTLLTMTQPLGSVGWWDWQYKLQKMKETSDKLFTADYQQLVRIQNILFQLIKMRVTDDAVLHFLKSATSQGSIVMGLTARGKEHLSATMLQLKDNDFTIGNKPLFQEKGLKFKNNKTSVAGNVHCPQFTHEVIYQQGIMFLDGEDKGQALLCVLTKTKKEIKTILFVDDAIKNTVSVNKAFSDSKGLRVLNIHFTKENAKQLEIQQNPNLQSQIFDQWNQIKKNLDDVIINSNF